MKTSNGSFHFSKLAKLDKKIPVPLYYQLKQVLSDYVASGEVRDGDSFPSEAELSLHFGVSRPTVRQALQELVSENYLYRVKGKGTFVQKQKVEQLFTQTLSSFSREMREKGLVPRARVLACERRAADVAVASALGVAEGMEVVYLERLLYALQPANRSDDLDQHLPLVLVRSALPLDRCSALLEVDFERHSLYETLASLGMPILRVQRVFDARKVSCRDASALRMAEGDPILYFLTTGYSADAAPLEYGRSCYPGGRNRFSLEISLPPER